MIQSDNRRVSGAVVPNYGFRILNITARLAFFVRCKYRYLRESAAEERSQAMGRALFRAVMSGVDKRHAEVMSLYPHRMLDVARHERLTAERGSPCKEISAGA